MLKRTNAGRGDDGPRLTRGRLILRMPRDGIDGGRLLVDLKVPDLASFISEHPLGDRGLEHVFDY